MDLDFGDYFQFLFALIFVLALIGVLALVARRMGFGYRVPSRGRQERRLSVVEVLPIDGKRRLTLVRRDAVEHLILIGATSEVIVETGIPAAADFGSALAEATAPAGDGDRS